MGVAPSEPSGDVEMAEEAEKTPGLPDDVVVVGGQYSFYTRCQCGWWNSGRNAQEGYTIGGGWKDMISS